MKEQTFKVRKFELEIYEINLHVIVSNDRNRSYGYFGENEIDCMDDPFQPNAGVFADNNDIVMVLNSDKQIDCPLIAHEIVHVMNKILLIIGNENRIELDEITAYHNEYLFRLVYKFCKEENLLELRNNLNQKT